MENEPTPEYTVRQMVADDIVPLRHMHARSWLATYPNEAEGVPLEWLEETTSSWLTEEGIKKSHEHFKDILGYPNHFHHVAVDTSGEIVGFIHGSRLEGGQRIEGLYLDEHVQGTGLAQKMVDELMGWFDLSCDIELEVVSYNERAKAFYRKCGFRETDKVNELFKGKLPNTTMVRKGTNNEA